MLACFTDDSDWSMTEVLIAHRIAVLLKVRADRLTHELDHFELAASPTLGVYTNRKVRIVKNYR